MTRWCDFLERCRRVLAGALAAAALAAPACAQTRSALLVGVSDYPASTGAKPLPGAANDVALMHTVLLRTGFPADRITVLSDRFPGAAAPTRDNILRALRRMAEGAKAGDYFYLHFSGHGSQQPVDPNVKARRVEPDGLNEIFLPIDIGKWDGTRSTVVNAIVNRELEEILDQFLSHGAFVWAVFDSCHSAALMRGGPEDEVTLREVDPTVLGIPQQALDRAAASATVTRGEADAPVAALADLAPAAGAAGGFVAFYAAQTTEPAPEMAMPASLSAGHPDKKPHGVLTFTLAEALATNPQASYRQLSQFILSRYSSQYISNKPTPIFTGTLLDAPAFGSSLAAPVRQWQIAREQPGGGLTIAAGRLAQLGEGAQLAVMANPAAATEQAIARATVSSAGMFSSQLSLVPGSDGKTLAAAELPVGAYARLVRPAVELTLRVALPAAPAKAAADARRKADAATDALRKDPPAGARIEWLPAGRGADIRLHEEDGRLWFLPASGALSKSGSDRTVSIGLEGEAGVVRDSLASTLVRIAKAVNLVRIAEQMPPGAAVAGVDVKLELIPASAGAKPQLVQPVGGRLRGESRLRYTITNRGRLPVDVTILYIDSQFDIGVMFPRGAANNRIEPGGVLVSAPSPSTVPDVMVYDDTTGTERLLVIVSGTTPQGDRIDYSDLAQPRPTHIATRGEEPSVLRSLFDEAAFGITTRAGNSGRDEPAAMKVYTWDVRKR